jgi:hypothetical protein
MEEPSPTEDAKASSALFNKNGFYWGSRHVKVSKRHPSGANDYRGAGAFGFLSSTVLDGLQKIAHPLTGEYLLNREIIGYEKEAA